MTCRMRRMGTALLALSLGGCAHGTRHDIASVDVLRPQGGPVAIVRASSLRWEGQQAYIPLFADGTASGLVVVNLGDGLVYGTGIPESWTWLDEDRVEICGSIKILRNEGGFPPMERDCAPYSITGKEVDSDDDGDIDLIETFAIMHPLFYRERPRD